VPHGQPYPFRQKPTRLGLSFNAMSFKTSPLLLAAGLAALAVSGCTPLVATRGNLVDDQRLSKVQVGTSTRDDVRGVLGTPTATGTVDPNTWYYIGRVTEQNAFFTPEVVKQRILRARFDPEGKLSAMDEISGDEAQDIEPNERITPTVGRDVTFIEQILGNLSRPAKKKDDKKKK